MGTFQKKWPSMHAWQYINFDVSGWLLVSYASYSMCALLLCKACTYFVCLYLHVCVMYVHVCMCIIIVCDIYTYVCKWCVRMYDLYSSVYIIMYMCLCASSVYMYKCWHLSDDLKFIKPIEQFSLQVLPLQLYSYQASKKDGR